MKFLRYTVLVMVLLALLLAGLIGLAPTWLRLGLSLYGIEDVAFDDLSIGWDQAKLDGLTVRDPATQTIDRITADFSLTGLLSGRIDRVTVTGLAVEVSINDSASGDNDQSDEGDRDPFLIPADPAIGELLVEKSRLDLETPLGRLSVPFDGRAETRDNRLNFSLDAQNMRLGSLEAALFGDLAIEGYLPVGDAPDPQRAAISGKLSLDGFDAPLPELAASVQGRGLISFDLEGAMDDLEGRLALNLEGLGWSSPQKKVRDVRLEQEFALAFDGRFFDLAIAEQGLISIDQVSLGDQLESGWFTIQLKPGDTPLLRVDLDGDRRWQHRLDLEVDPVRLETPSGQWWTRIEDFSSEASGNADGFAEGALTIRRGRADMPSANLALVGIETAVRLNAEGLGAESIPLTIQSLRPLGEPKGFAPLRLDAAITPTEESIDVEGKLATRTRPAAALAFAGGYRPKTDQGSVTFDLAKVAFAAGGLQPGDFTPILGDTLSETVGSIALAGRADWRNGKLTGSADLLIEELGLTIGPARLERVNTLMRFDNLWPPTMPEGQELAIGLLDVGLPLTDGLVSLQLGADGRLAVDHLTWRFADGKVSAAPFTFGSDVKDLTMVLNVDQLDLNGLLGLTRLDGLSGEGRVDGVLPITLSETAAVIAGGKLEATNAGVLRYRPDEAPSAFQAGGASIGLVLQALENFHYDELSITLDGRTDGDTDIDLHIRGANPDLYDGYPIEFNLGLDGNLAALVQTNISNYQIPDRIRERLQGFEQ